ncbi:GNAT family N-acetyltransferase [Raineyella fluvialis]|uniref:GNAT family N-acetyltransferase n=1 Tax=Raineyella fluvialis TaxID=2662261 RepID=UPI001E487688|nr:GNAT family N-acetyltransferase [Raineyella fluvialis]
MRPLAYADLDHLAELYAVPSVVRYLNSQGPSLEWTRRELAGFERHWATYGFGQSALIERATGQFIGRVGLQVRDPWDDIELLYVIARDRQRRGYASEAAAAWIAWAREQGLASRLVVVIHPRHEAALRTARALGFQPDLSYPTAWAGDRIAHRLAPVAETAGC